MRSLTSPLGSLAVALILTGCPADDDGTTVGGSGDTSSSGATTTASTTASTTDSTTASTTASTTDSTTDSTSASTTESTTAEAESGGEACGDIVCAANEYCDWPVNSCGTDPSDVPVCSPRPDDCPPSAGDPVCGCDGAVHVNDCGAASEGIDVHEANDCATPDGLFACGYLFCDPLYSYCQVSTSDVGGYPNGYVCMPLPKACGETPSCECLADETCGGFGCETTRDGGLQVVCPGG